MSTPDKPDHARGWRYVEKLLADEEAELLHHPTDDELRAEFSLDLPGPVPEWSVDELMAMAQAKLAEKVAAKAASTEPADAPSSAAAAEPSAPVVPIRKRWHPAWLIAAALLGGFLLYRATKARKG